MKPSGVIIIIAFGLLYAFFVPLPSNSALQTAAISGNTLTAAASPLYADIENPLGTDDLTELVKKIAKALLTLAIPIAAIMIIYAGIVLITAQGNEEKIKKGQKILWYAIIGLAVVLIGQGFVTLVKSILSMAK